MVWVEGVKLGTQRKAGYFNSSGESDIMSSYQCGNEITVGKQKVGFWIYQRKSQED